MEIKPHPTRCKYPLINYLTFLGGVVINGEWPADWPTQDPKQTCNGWGDCQYGERCQLAASYLDISYCVPDSCQKNVDCPDVGHIVHGLITSKGCNKGICVYEEGIIIAK